MIKKEDKCQYEMNANEMIMNQRQKDGHISKRSNI